MFNIDKQQVLDAFRHRRATRAYDPSKKISPDDFAYILELARLSPSSIGSEPWQFLVVQNAELRGRLKPVSWGMASQVDDCSHLVVILAKKNARWDSAFLRAGLEKRGLDEEGMQRALAVYEKFQKHDMKTADDERALFDWCCPRPIRATCPACNAPSAKLKTVLPTKARPSPNVLWTAACIWAANTIPSSSEACPSSPTATEPR